MLFGNKPWTKKRFYWLEKEKQGHSKIWQKKKTDIISMKKCFYFIILNKMWENIREDNTSSTENIKEISRVTEIIKKELNDFNLAVFYKKDAEGKNVTYDINAAKNYLTKIKDNFQQCNCVTGIMAVQILLESQGYDVGKIDGIFRSKNQTESNTMKAIKKFQREHGLTPNGIINKTTVQALTENTSDPTDGEEVPTLTETAYKGLMEKKLLTTHEREQLVKYYKWEKVRILSKDEYEKLCKKQNLQDSEFLQIAKYILLHWENGELSLRNLQDITQNQIQALTKLPNLTRIRLDWLTNLSDNTAKELAKIPNIRQFMFNWLTNISDNAAKELAKSPNLTFISLQWLRNLSDDAAKELAPFTIYINMDILTDNQKKILNKASSC